MAFILRLCLWLILIGLLAAPVVAYYGLDDEPLVTTGPKVELQDLQAARAFLDRYDPRNLPANRDTLVAADQRQINAALGAALSAAPMVKAKVVPSRFGVLGAVTGELPLPANPFGRYANVRLLVESSRDGLRIGRLSVGDIEIPPIVIRPVFIVLMDQVAGPGSGRAMLETIRSVEVRGDRVEVVYRPKEGLIDDLKTAAKKVVAVGDPEVARQYYEKLLETYRLKPKIGHVSLSEFIRPLFELAIIRSGRRDPVEENRNAILALGMFFGDIRLEQFVGEVRKPEYGGPPPNSDHVRLQGRHDWVQHFTLSAALTLTGGRGIADFIGEAKEVEDAGKDSGFSFTDIGADRAGVRFADVATRSGIEARRVQKELSRRIDENEFFPTVNDLPEGLSEAEFRRRFGDRESAAFKEMISKIDRRIDAIALYR